MNALGMRLVEGNQLLKVIIFHKIHVETYHHFLLVSPLGYPLNVTQMAMRAHVKKHEEDFASLR